MSKSSTDQNGPSWDVSPDVVNLGLVAAPFAASGASEEEAIERAVKLLYKCYIRLSRAQKSRKKKIQDLADSLTLDQMLDMLELKTPKQLKVHLAAISADPSQMRALWSRAQKGEAVFNAEIANAIYRHRDALRRARNRKATAARLAK